MNRHLEVTTLARRAIDGDRCALGCLAALYRPRILQVALRYTRDEADAQDVCQETLLSMILRIRECRNPAALPAWLSAIARNHAISMIRRRARRALVPLEAASAVASQADPLAEVEWMETRGQVERAAGSLPRMQREVLALVDMQGLRHREAAGVLGISEGAARVHLHHARRTLRRQLAR